MASERLGPEHAQMGEPQAHEENSIQIIGDYFTVLRYRKAASAEGFKVTDISERDIDPTDSSEGLHGVSIELPNGRNFGNISLIAEAMRDDGK